MLLRAMAKDDVQVVSAIENSTARFPWPHTQIVDSLAADHQCTVLTIDNIVQGFSIFSSVLDETTLLNIAVSPDIQSRGYGRQLLEQGLLLRQQAGAKKCFLEVRVSNTKAQALYQSVGFVVVGERKKYYPITNGREKALVMSLDMMNQA